MQNEVLDSESLLHRVQGLLDAVISVVLRQFLAERVIG